MQTIYQAGWIGYDCTTTTWSILALTTGIFAAVIGFFAWLGIRHARRHAAPDAERIVWWITGASAVGLAFVAVYVVAFDGPFYRQIAFDGASYQFEGCDGTRPVNVRLPLADIRDTSYRGRWTGGKSSRLVHEIVLTRDDGQSFVIPLDRDADPAHLAALAGALPEAVANDYAAALRARNQEPPAAFRAR